MPDRFQKYLRSFRVRPDSQLNRTVELRCIRGQNNDTLWYTTPRLAQSLAEYSTTPHRYYGVTELEGLNQPVPLKAFREARLKFKLRLNQHRSAVQIPLHWFPNWFNFHEMLERSTGDLYLTGRFPLYHSDIQVQVLFKIINTGSFPFWCLYIGSDRLSQRELMHKGRKLFRHEAEQFLSVTTIFNWILQYPYWN